MKKIPIIHQIIILSLISVSCYNTDFNNPNDRYADSYTKDNAQLSGLILSDGNLSPGFNPDITVYTVNLPYLISSITVTPESVNNHSTINIDGLPINSGDTSDSIYIDYGDKDILIIVTSEDGTKLITYTLKITRYENNDNNFYAFKLLKINNNVLNSDILGVIDASNKTVEITVPYGTAITDLIATYIVGDFATVEIEGVQQESGITHNDFSGSLPYTIIAQNDIQSNYIVHVTVAPNTAKDFTTFKFFASNNSEYLSQDVTGIIDTTSATVKISLPVTLLAEVPSLVVSFTVSENASVYIDEIIQISGITGNDFTNATKYTIIAQDNSIKNYAVFVIRGNHEAYLKAPNNSNNDYFGSSVSISGDTIVVGAKSENSTTNSIINGSDLSSTDNSGFHNGAAYVFRRTNGIWTHEAYLKAPNNYNDNMYHYMYYRHFGSSVSISNGTIAVGTPGENSSTNSIINGSDLSSTDRNGYGNGAVYVFKGTDGIWSHEAYLKAPNNYTYQGLESYNFGDSVSISEDTIAVGAYAERGTTTNIINGSDLSSTTNYGNYRGAVYVFKRSSGIWSFEAYLKAPNSSEYDSFGNSVSISGDTIAVGAYEESSTSTVIINGSDLTSTNDNGTYNGAVYVFKRSSGIWSFEAYLKAPNNSNGDSFGTFVSISGDIIAVGVPNEKSTTTNIIYGSDLSSTNDNGSKNGAVYVFKRDGNIWTHEAYLKAPNNSNGDSFGTSVSISSDTIIVGASGEDSSTNSIINGSDLSSANDNGSERGAVYVFKRDSNIWRHKAYLKAPNNSNGDVFGNSVSISNGTVVVGATGEDSSTNTIINGSDLSSTNNSGNSNGAVYVFH